MSVTYKIEFLPAARGQLAALEVRDQKRIRNKIDRLAGQPRPPDAKRLHGKREYWRIRVGHYRVVYSIQGDQLLVLVIRIGHRREVYRGL